MRKIVDKKAHWFGKNTPNHNAIKKFEDRGLYPWTNYAEVWSLWDLIN